MTEWARRGVRSAFLLGLAGCASGMSRIYESGTDLPPSEAERRAEVAFQHYQIPVAEKSPDGRVRSGRFDPDVVWGVMAYDRIVCGRTDQDEARGRVQPAELEVLVTIRTRPAAGTLMSVESYGRGRTADGGTTQCSLTPEFSMEILASIEGNWRVPESVYRDS